MKKPYDKYVTKSSFTLIIGIVFLFIGLAATDNKFLSTVLILLSFLYLGMSFYCLYKERKEGEYREGCGDEKGKT